MSQYKPRSQKVRMIAQCCRIKHSRVSTDHQHLTYCPTCGAELHWHEGAWTRHTAAQEPAPRARKPWLGKKSELEKSWTAFRATLVTQ